MHRAGPASRPFVLATLRALRLDPGPYPVLSTRRPKGQQNHWSTTLLTKPRPFRDDSAPTRLEPAGDAHHCSAGERPRVHLVEHADHVFDVDLGGDRSEMTRPQ